MFHVNHEPGAEIHHTDPFAVPTGQRSPVRRLRGRLAAPVTLWTAPGPAGLTVSSTLVAEGEPDRLLGLIDPESRPLGGGRGGGPVRGRPARPAAPAARRPVRRAASRRRAACSPPARGPTRAYGPVPADAGSWAGCRLDTAREYGWGLLSRPPSRRSSWPRTPRRCCTTGVATTSCRLTGHRSDRVTRRSQTTARRTRLPASIAAFTGRERALYGARNSSDACEGGDPQMSTDTPASAPLRSRSKYLAVQRSDEFAGLRRALRGFVFPMTVAFFLWYALYVHPLRVRAGLHGHEARRQHQRRAGLRPAPVRLDVPDRLALLAVRRPASSTRSPTGSAPRWREVTP